jgi:hypothetical protein
MANKTDKKLTETTPVKSAQSRFSSGFAGGGGKKTIPCGLFGFKSPLNAFGGKLNSPSRQVKKFIFLNIPVLCKASKKFDALLNVNLENN